MSRMHIILKKSHPNRLLCKWYRRCTDPTRSKVLSSKEYQQRHSPKKSHPGQPRKKHLSERKTCFNILVRPFPGHVQDDSSGRPVCPMLPLGTLGIQNEKENGGWLSKIFKFVKSVQGGERDNVDTEAKSLFNFRNDAMLKECYRGTAEEGNWRCWIGMMESSLTHQDTFYP